MKTNWTILTQIIAVEKTKSFNTKAKLGSLPKRRFNMSKHDKIKELELEVQRLKKDLEFKKEQYRRLQWLFGLTGGPAFIEKVETKSDNSDG